MNSKQKKVFIIGLLLTIVICLFPPWTQTFSYKSTYTENPKGYSFIAEPPSPVSFKPQYGIKIDIQRLILQLIAVFALTGISLLTTRGITNK